MKSTVLQLFLRETMWKWGSNAQHLKDIEHLVLPTSTSVKTLRFYVKNKRKNNPQTKPHNPSSSPPQQQQKTNTSTMAGCMQVVLHTFYIGYQTVDFPPKLSRHNRSWVKAKNISFLYQLSGKNQNQPTNHKHKPQSKIKQPPSPQFSTFIASFLIEAL